MNGNGLNLPETDLRLEKRGEETYVWDFIRHRWIVLTPEEWVRQHFSHWMVERLGYPIGRLGHEISLKLNGMNRRCDAVFYDLQGKPQIIMEFKAPTIQISQLTFNQICRYNIVMQVPLLIVSNGITHYCCLINDNGKKIEFLRNIPCYEGTPDFIARLNLRPR